MGHGHSHHNHSHRPESSKALFWAIVVNLLLSLGQFILGVFSGSLSLIADAAHNLGDVGALVIAFVAQRVAGFKASSKMTYGFARAEVLGAFVNSLLLIATALFLIYEAVERWGQTYEIKGFWVIVGGGLALVIDLFTAYLTYKGSKDSQNMKAAFIHNLSDAMASVVVIVTGVLSYYVQASLVDAIATLSISLFILYHSYGMVVSTLRTLMQAVPVGVKIEDIQKKVSQLNGVIDMHHVHVWEMDENKKFLEAHIVTSAKDLITTEQMKKEVKKVLKEDFDIHHSTLEFEHTQDSCDSKSSSSH